MPTKPRTATQSENSISALLIRLGQGDRSVENPLIEQIYGELRRLARYYMRKERANHTLQATALVNEAYLRLVGSAPIACNNRTHFLALAARAMRHVLADYGEARHAEKRGGGLCRVTLGDAIAAAEDQTVETMSLKEALERLRHLNERQARIVEMRELAGLTFDEIAEHVGTSAKTVERDWKKARAWLKLEIAGRI